MPHGAVGGEFWRKAVNFNFLLERG